MRKWYETYYADDIEADGSGGAVRHWMQLLLELQPDLQERVSLAYRQWNMPVRDLLRNETGLRLSTGGVVTQVPVRVVDGFPPPFSSFLEEYAGVAELLLRRRAVQAANHGLNIVQQDYEKWVARIPGDAVTKSQIEAVTKWIGSIDSFLDKARLEHRFRQINEDCLGAYFFNGPRVELYWAVIGVVANQTGASVEGLTVVALAHELAHAYTHLGKDIDGTAWDTQAFAHGDIMLIEGLAQFYTHVICTKLAARFPAALNAYNVLLEMQSEVYTEFVRWVAEWKNGQDRRGESVRAGLIQVRRLGYCDYGQFRSEMESRSY